MSLECAALTDVGRMREQNEDALSFDEDLGLVVLADGMGGHKAGEVASDLAVATIMSYLKKYLAYFSAQSVDPKLADVSIPELLREAVLQANHCIFKQSSHDETCNGMGTTLVAAWFFPQTMYIANVGDSRLYRFRHSMLEQMTRDDTVLQDLIDKGLLTDKEIEEFRQKNLLTRALGVDCDLNVSIAEEKWKEGDLYLLCSDGLTDMLKQAEIGAILAEMSSSSLAEIAKRLVTLANQKGGRDNISVLLARPCGEGNIEDKTEDETMKGWWRFLLNWKGFKS
jgi:PPM family protein phosphatase